MSLREKYQNRLYSKLLSIIKSILGIKSPSKYFSESVYHVDNKELLDSFYKAIKEDGESE